MAVRWNGKVLPPLHCAQNTNPSTPDPAHGLGSEALGLTSHSILPIPPGQENGRVKLELIRNSQVFITYHQLEDLSQVSADKPELMTRRLLDYFFSRETLARSSAAGQRIAHNNMTMEKPIPLPVAVVNAIKGMDGGLARSGFVEPWWESD